MFRVILTIFVVGLSTTALANENTDRLWNDFNKTIIKNDCKASLVKLEHLIKIDPNMAYAQKAFLYEKGRCLPRDIDKAIQNYQMVPKEKLDSMFALNLAHLLFTKAQTPIEKKEALSGVRDILLDHITLVETGYELEKYIGILYPNSPAFLSALSSEFDFFKSIDANPSLKLNQSEKLMEEGHFPDVAKFWLGQLTQKDNPRANYLYAKYFDGNLKFYSGFLRSAAKQGIPEAQIALADIHAKKGTAVGYRFAYFWYLKAAQNGTDVKEQLNLLKEKLSKNDISIIEGEVLNKDSTYQ